MSKGHFDNVSISSGICAFCKEKHNGRYLICRYCKNPYCYDDVFQKTERDGYGYCLCYKCFWLRANPDSIKMI